MEINYVCSLGTLCHTSQLLKINKIKKCSYPFDWIFSNCDIIIHCLEDNFNIFLDKSYYIDISNTICGHSYYEKQMFNHFNPLINENHYNYYVRCVDRFKLLLQNKESKLFIIMFLNRDNFETYYKDNIINFNNTFSKYTTNYRLLAIYNIHKKQTNHHIFTHIDNIDILELHTLSTSIGTTFINNIDNDYLNNIINKTYSFNVEP